MMLFEVETGAFLAALVRFSAWAHTAPFIGDRIVPARVRMAAIAGLAFAASGLHTTVAPSSLFAVLPGELLLGLVAGFSTRLVIAGIEAGGQIIGTELGLGFAGTIDPAHGDESLPTRRLAYALAGLAFLRAGGLEACIGTLAVKPLEGLSFVGMLPELFDRGAQVFIAAIRLSAPLLLASVIANVTMAIASRAAPALNVFSVMLALFLVVGAAVLLATAPAFARELEHVVALAKETGR